jgi:hypothetical protein
MPSLIVARAENLLGDADLDRLGRHLERCPTCRATEAAFRRAERAYVATTHAPLDSATTALFLSALADAAPIEGTEPAPAAAPEPAPAVEDLVLEEQMVEDHVLEEHVVEPEPDEYDHTDDEGWTGEQEGVVDHDTYDHHMIEPGPATWNATEEPSRRRRRLRIVVPVAVLAVGAAVAMTIAGVFDGSSRSSTVDTRTVQSTSVAPPKSATTP